MHAEAAPRALRASLTILLLTCLTMVAFAANSLLTRAALQTTGIDAASFTAIRVAGGAATLLIVLRLQGGRLERTRTGWLSALLLFAYVAAFTFAYRGIGTGAGALVLFACAQLLMISYGLSKGERASPWGLLLALGGLAVFLAPSASAPPLLPAAMMALAGFAWGGFSLLGKASGSPIANTATSFLWAVPPAAVLVLVTGAAHPGGLHPDPAGAVYALVSGSVTSGLGYAVWYWVRTRMTAIGAGAVQLSVPVISALLGVLLLGEHVTARSALSGLATLGGVAWVTLTARKA
ncbi:DMT family transporter [Massilia sp. YIM B02763]|uniref:DMT family transporter n=1 Tax=Massilia sp. YIM B02763 TaxID=3050130 RepID=UPI0025B70E9B|nr:DMT family transporter [Massilia sp. YIM B02763]MDN4054336.1 DMT family transporter [Massilia sp. YIM B02763]